jgi:PAS domain S-box-containing protein
MDVPDDSEENRRLRRTMRDLVALSTLPAVWSGLPLAGIARSLADVLVDMLALDLVYISLASPIEKSIEIVRARNRREPVAAEAVRALVEQAMTSEGAATLVAPAFLGGGDLQVAVTRFGIGAEHGTLITASARPSFPTEQDRLLLGVGANQTAIVLQRRRAEDEARIAGEQARTILESITDAFLAVDQDWRFTYLNRQAEEVFERTRADLLGKVLWDEYPGLIGSEFEKVYRAAAARTAGSVTSYFPDHERWYEVHAYPATNGIAVYFRDVTVQKLADDEQRKMAADLAEADRRKNEFLATLAHELRNPLAPIRTGVQILRLAGDVPSVVEDAREMMDRQLGQMVRLIDDLMDISRITSGKVELRKERVALTTVVNSAIETSRPLIASMGHQLEVTFPTQHLAVDADVTRLSQVFMNLLNNAAKYSEHGSRIHLSVTRDGDDVVVSVKDHGIGIAADQLPTIFDMFAQVDRSLERSQGGLGIGLTLVKRLVEMHGGTVVARSEGPNLGAELIVRLPLVVEEHVSDAVDRDDNPPIRSSLRILIVDDNEDGADTLASMLEYLGNDIRVAYDGEAAVAASAEFRPDVVLLDIGLPKLNGYDACRRIRLQPGGEALVIIAQTGWGQLTDRELSREAGFDHHMVKPLDPAALQKLLGDVQRARGNR